MFQVYNFTTATGRQPVKKFINNQEKGAKEKLYAVIGHFKQHGFHLETNYLRRMSGTKKLWELRTKYRSNQYRIFFAKISEQSVILLHAIVKKSNQTPRKEIQTAEKRLHELTNTLKKGEV